VPFLTTMLKNTKARKLAEQEDRRLIDIPSNIQSSVQEAATRQSTSP